MSDIVDDLKYSSVPKKNKKRWIQDVMERAAEEIIELRRLKEYYRIELKELQSEIEYREKRAEDLSPYGKDTCG